MDKLIKYSDLYMEFPAAVIQITSLEIIEELNEHGRAFLCLVTEDKGELLNEITSHTDIKIAAVQKENTIILFCGIPTKITIKKIQNVSYVQMELKSKSFLLDCKKKSRSFQNTQSTFESLFREIVEKENKGICSDTASKGKCIKEPLIQYQETDWEFIKRMASKLKAKIITNVADFEPVITIGKQKGQNYIEDKIHYELVNEAQEYHKAQENFGGWKQIQKIYYKIESVNYYKLYDKLIYNKIYFTIVKKKTCLKDGIIFFTYWLLTESGIRQDLIQNNKLSGIGIEGKVLAVLGDRVKIHLSIDKEQPIKEAYWYKCENPYTAEGKTGFYAMPQKGDKAILYFSESNAEGYVRTFLLKEKETNFNHYHPNIKYYENNNGKGIAFSPSELQVSAEKGFILIDMDEKKGIEITSSDNILIKTDGRANLSANKIALRSGSEVWMATKSSSMIIDYNINVKADGGVTI